MSKQVRMALSAFNTQLIDFVDELSQTYTEEKDLAKALNALKALKKVNPKLIHSGFMEYVYPDFAQHVKDENEEALMTQANNFLNGEFSEYAFTYVIFARHWTTMSETNKRAIWNYCKVIVALAEKAAGM